MINPKINYWCDFKPTCYFISAFNLKCVSNACNFSSLVFQTSWLNWEHLSSAKQLLQIPVWPGLHSQTSVLSSPVPRPVCSVLTYLYKQELDFILVFSNTISLTQIQCYSYICDISRLQRTSSSILFWVTTSFLCSLDPVLEHLWQILMVLNFTR